MNKIELANKVMRQVVDHPETHDQGHFEALGKCGTVRCVAGWTVAIAFKTNRILDVIRKEMRTTSKIAAGLLGLSEEDRIRLFFGCDKEEEAVKALEYLARGESIDWKTLEMW